MALGDERRASGRTMEAERRQIGRDLVNDLQSLSGPSRSRRALSAVAPVGALASKRGRALWNPAASGVGGGIASPLSEPEFSARQYWASGLPSSDGLFMIPAIKTMNLVDASGAAVVIQLADPGAV
ncbi:hypothetical protein FQZ97_324040 [compost metagenome]